MQLALRNARLHADVIDSRHRLARDPVLALGAVDIEGAVKETEAKPPLDESEISKIGSGNRSSRSKKGIVQTC